MDKQKIVEKQSAGYNGLYLERSGIGSAYLAEKLVLPPERPLDDSGKSEVRQFEADMLATQVDIGITLEDALRIPMIESRMAPLFFTEGLMSGEVQIEGVDLPKFTSPDEVYKWVATSGLGAKKLMELSKKSTEVYKNHTAVALVEGRTIDEATTESQPVVIDPDGFARDMRHLRAARGMLLDQRSSAPRGTDSDDAKVAYNDIFLAKINAQLATGIPIVGYLYEQAKLTHNYAMELTANSLVSEGLIRVIQNDVSLASLHRRLDFLRNGIGISGNGTATGISAEVASVGGIETPKEGVFTPEQMRLMKETMLQPGEMQQIFKDILASAGLLSSEDESTYTLDRKHRASDELFQVVVNPSGATFVVDSIDGVYKVPSEPRSLYDVMMVGGFHELEHVNQALADDTAGAAVKIAKIKGKRVLGLREAGANMRQRAAEEELFGHQKPYADTYASALRVLEEGGSIGDAIAAFYDAKVRAIPDIDKMKAAREAADRVLRLMRGGINSQPMVYAEESILVHELSGTSPEVQARAIAVTGLDLVDQARLHKFGLLDVPEGTHIDWHRHIMKVLSKRLSNIGINTHGEDTDTHR